jgi:hypothetical protein
MPAAKKDSVVEKAPVEEPKAAPKPKQPERWELAEEFELLKAQGNKNPARLAELKKLLAS